MIEDINRKKMMIRSRVKQTRKMLHDDESLDKGLKVQLMNKSTPIWRFLGGMASGKVIGGYYPIGSEPNILPLLEELRAKNEATIVLPRVLDKRKPLSFHHFDNVDTLVRSEHCAAMEPSKGSKAFLPEVLLVPLLAFDVEGYRLGYGGGYYDRTLQNFHDNGDVVTTIGIGYESLKMTEPLPRGEYDQKLDYIVTEARVYTPNS